MKHIILTFAAAFLVFTGIAYALINKLWIDCWNEHPGLVWLGIFCLWFMAAYLRFEREIWRVARWIFKR